MSTRDDRGAPSACAAAHGGARTLGGVAEIDAHLLQLDHAWEHVWESLTAALDGVTQEEAFWQAPCYAGEEREEGWPPPGTIAWQLAHVTHCKRYYAAMCRQAGAPGPPDVVPWTPCATLAELRAAVAGAHAEERAAIAALGDERLGLTAGNGIPFREFVAGCVRHVTWHASQIAVARRLYRARDPAEGL